MIQIYAEILTQKLGRFWVGRSIVHYHEKWPIVDVLVWHPDQHRLATPTLPVTGINFFTVFTIACATHLQGVLHLAHRWTGPPSGGED
jgi:hypothetical protein